MTLTIRDSDLIKDDVSEISLRPNDFDVAGHLNNSVYPELLEAARWRWGRANGLDVKETTLVAVVLSLNLDYLKALEWDPVGSATVRTRLVEQKAYSFAVDQEIEDATGDLVARATVRLALIDRTTKKIHRADLAAIAERGR